MIIIKDINYKMYNSDLFFSNIYLITRFFTFLIEALSKPLVIKKKRCDIGKVIKITRRFQEILSYCINGK